MRLKLGQLTKNKHSDIVVGVDWTSASELLSISDDRRVLKWSIDGVFLGELISCLEVFITEIHCQVGNAGGLSARVF